MRSGKKKTRILISNFMYLYHPSKDDGLPNNYEECNGEEFNCRLYLANY